MIQERVVFGALVMSSALALLGILTAATVTINKHNDTITIDCYERLASGQRLHATDVYKTINVTTLQDCQIACTEEKEMCRSLSYGAAVKGNASSCEMSNKIVKETVDLKPIGTINDTDHDLYIKKTGCTLVLDLNHKHKDTTNNKTQNDMNYYNTNKDTDRFGKPYPDDQSFEGAQEVPYRPFIQDDPDYENPWENGNRRPGYGFMYAPNFYGPPIKVQSSLIGVSPLQNGEGIYSHQNYQSISSSQPVEEQSNSLDVINSSDGRFDRLPPLFSSSNHIQPQMFYAEEGNYEQHHHSDHFSASSYQYAIPMPENVDNRYPLENDQPPFGHDEAEHEPTRYRGGNYPPWSHGHIGFDRPKIPNDPYYESWPSYDPFPSPPAPSEFTYGNRYPYYKQFNQGNPNYIQTVNDRVDNPIVPLSTNKTGNIQESVIEKNVTIGLNNNTGSLTSSVSFASGSKVSQTKGPNGGIITSIITELNSGESILSVQFEGRLTIAIVGK